MCETKGRPIAGFEARSWKRRRKGKQREPRARRAQGKTGQIPFKKTRVLYIGEYTGVVEERCMLTEAVPQGAVDGIQERMLA